MTGTVLAELRGMRDRQLEWFAQQLEHRIAALRVPTTRAAAAMLQEYRDKLYAVRAEVERRRTP